ncbi:hypothetical protein DQP57_00380 [Mycobacterium colombiense]|uniref:Phage tail tape measure protein domain-containing protein n=1 Tax=Mycobacterium colombiense TaxID=339268 RepID=A0A329MBR4_9MYCO|nr:phage tail tape measure protein [Mycobacterium colombiense]RAV17515.1 hypothetical protein DQP57_00380 [Mycobacterium colombiense]
MAEGGIFLDILARLNMASVDRVLADVRTIMRDAGAKSARAFEEGFRLDAATSQFKELSAAADLAYRDMQRGLADLQIQEARVNELRARNFKASTDAMISAQRDLDAAIANSMKLMETANARAAEQRAAAVTAVPTRGRSGEEPERRGRSQAIPMSRGANIIGAGAAIGTAVGVAEGARVSADTSRNMQQVRAFHQDPTHTQDYINRQTQSIYQMSTQVPYSPQELSKVYQDIENHGYTGQAALDLLSTAAKTAVSTQADLKDTTDGLMTTVKDFGVQAQLQSTNLDEYKKGLEDLNQMAGQLVGTFGQLKGVNPDEFFRSLGSVEPTAMKYMANLSGPAASAQVNSALSLLAQVGIGPEQGSHNVSRIMAQLGSIPPGSKIYNMLGQLGVKPEDIVTTTRDKGIFAPLQMIQGAIASRTNDAGMVNIGWRYNNQQVSELEQQGYQNLSPEGKAFVDSHPEIRQGLASKMSLRKALKGTDLGAGEIGDISTLAQWYSMSNGPNKFTKQGEPTEVTPGQVYQILFGTGDIARTGAILGNSAQEGQQVADQLTKTGSDALKNAFKDMMSQLPEQWKQLGASLQSLAGQMGQHLLPALTRFVGDLNGVADWLDRHKTAEEALVGTVGAIATAWGAAKIVNIFSDLAGPLGKLKDAANTLGGIMSDRLPTQVGGLGTAAETTAGEIRKSGIGSALRGAAANVSAAFSRGALTLAIAQTVGGALDASGLPTPGEITQHHPGASTNPVPSWLQDPKWLQGIGKFFGMYDGQGGKAHGGIVGFDDGGVTNPYSQPLMSVPDKGIDTVLGMLPNGTPVGLRGGEGILTPEAVNKLGGKGAIDALNNPWADPLKVGATFYGSFAKGVAKYSPFGKYLTATSQTIDSLVDEFEKSNEAHEAGHGRHHRKGLPSEIEGLLSSGLSPEEVMQKLGVKAGKRGGLELPSGQYLSNEDRALLGLPAAKSRGGGGPSSGGLIPALRRAGIDPSMYPLLQGFAKTEGDNPSGVPTLGFTDSQAGSSLDEHAQALANQIRNRQSVAGPFPANGSPQEQASWMATVVGQNGVQSDWQGNAQPSRQDYVNRVASGFGPKYWFSQGGQIPTGDLGPLYGTSPGPTPGGPGSQLYPGPGSGGINSTWVPDWWNKALRKGSGQHPWWQAPYNGSPPPPANDQGPHRPPVDDNTEPFGYSTGGIVGFDGGGFVPTPSQPGVGAAQASTNITTAAQARGIAPQDGGKAPDIAPKDMPNHVPAPGNTSTPPQQLKNQPPPPATPDRRPPGSDKGPDKAKMPQFTAPGGKPGDYTTPEDTRNLNNNPSREPGINNTSKGFGVSGGLIGTAEGAAEMAASTAANAFAPGSGAAASQAMNIGFQLANRAMGYAGQLAGIGIEGIMETFLPNDSALGDPTNNILGKMAMGIAGAHPSPKNTAGNSAMKLDPKENLDAGAMAGKQQAPIHIENVHNHGQQSWEGLEAAQKKAVFQGTMGNLNGASYR